MIRRLALSTLCLAVFSAAASADALRVRLGEDPETLYNVQTISLTANQTIGTYLLDRLVYIDGDGQPKPWLATGWQVAEDQKQVTVTLRPGIKFHDGTAFDAAAVKFHFDTILDRSKASPLLPLAGPMTGVEAVDPATVRFTFERPFAPFIINLSLGSMGINSPTAVAKHGRQYGRNPVGTGPYMLKSWVPGSEITLTRNPNYRQFRDDAVHKGAPRTAEVVLTVIPEESVAMAALETGELTVADVSGDAMRKFANDPRFNVAISKRATNLVFLEFNRKRPPFDDLRVRQALSHAIDREAALAAGYNGYGDVAQSPLAAGIPGHDAAIAQRLGTKYDPARAKALLAEAGWVPGPGGILRKDGREAKFSLKSYAGFATIERTLAVVQNNLADLGIQVAIETSDWGTFYPSLLKGEWDLDLMRWTWSDPGVLNNLYRSPGHRRLAPPNAELDATLDRCNATVEPTARAACVSEAQRLLLEDATIVPILSNWRVQVVQKNVQDFTLDFFSNVIPGDVRIGK